ncbi:hypothetical protein [Parvularcula sp. IMCC14364]|uniref:hypothetical protein n=1 Tax=Parvularcula sp. IMCC14364 TaxID=3067902 RepID=UPI0027415AF3|nr:hypothetical protein [Parvularcula sp. IMCC14364]
MEFGITLWAALGFIFAAYAVVGNDALQTLGTFINSNSRLPWQVLFLFASVIVVATFTLGWFIYDGDPSWGRLANTSKYPPVEVQWYHTLPPLVLLVITRFGVPVSTSFMVLTVFATVGGLASMLEKSLIGYGLAFLVGLLVYVLITNTLEKFFREHEPGRKAPWGLATVLGIIIGTAIYYIPPMINEEISYGAATCIGIAIGGLIIDVVAITSVVRFQNSTMAVAMSAIVAAVTAFAILAFTPSGASLNLGFASMSREVASVVFSVFAFLALYVLATRVSSGRIVYWIILQWVTTAYLWGVWLIQDFANIFVFLPRELLPLESFGAMFVIVGLLGYTFANKGGPVQKILRAKTAVTDIRSATVIDFIYATLLFFFKEVSDIPMSTTFVFLGLIAGREYGFTIMTKAISYVKTSRLVLSDASKAVIGLVLSINMAVGLPFLAKSLSEGTFDTAAVVPNAAYGYFLIIVNLLIIPISLYLMNNSRARMIIVGSSLIAAVVLFFSTSQYLVS